MSRSPSNNRISEIIIIYFILYFRYHQYRIANAIFKMTFSHLNMTANERRRQEQSTALKRFQGVQAVVTLSQLIGTVIIFYSPTYLQVRQYNCQQNANVGG